MEKSNDWMTRLPRKSPAPKAKRRKGQELQRGRFQRTASAKQRDLSSFLGSLLAFFFLFLLVVSMVSIISCFRSIFCVEKEFIEDRLTTSRGSRMITYFE